MAPDDSLSEHIMEIGRGFLASAAAREIGEVGVGVNMLPHSDKELAALLPPFDRVGIRTHGLIYDRAKTLPWFWGTRFWRWCARCSARSRQREALSRLDDRLLADIGATRQEADAEAAKPFWK